MRIVIVGGGIGGLCLAQGLARAGVPFTVYERDAKPDSRLQGYRLNIEPIGAQALQSCLPPALWTELVDTAGDVGDGMGVFDEQLHELMREPTPPANLPPERQTHAVSRVTLRRLLLSGLWSIAERPVGVPRCGGFLTNRLMTRSSSSSSKPPRASDRGPVDP
jgi:2-polyprenyl-6-methoxyphenol hydroxylase-like FAD-dependent oxidoreductase